jgi:hypothetical protein
MPPVGIEPTIPTGERPHTYALDRAATGTGIAMFSNVLCYNETRVLILRLLRMFEMNSCFPCAKDFVVFGPR